MGEETAGPPGARHHVYAVIRIDEGMPVELGVTVKEIVPSEREAEQEVRRLNTLNADKGAHYFWQVTRFFPRGRSGAREDARS